ncbi:MAG TPA: hypothetical protein H9733_03160 [Candidatus Anaerotignum merdipullorum]|nr:hypothetical protein [Candidatus Anaerotignum merdipullorum]
MLELIQEERMNFGVDVNNFISIHFEDLCNVHPLNAMAMHGELLQRAE